MTKYLVFKFSNHDESGGWNDFSTAHTELKDAIASAEKLDGNQYAQIVDLTLLKVVADRFLWSEGNLMVTNEEFNMLKRKREEQIAAIQRSRGLIA